MSSEFAYGIAVDAKRERRDDGEHAGDGLPDAQPAGYDAGGTDVFVTKLNAAGSALIYSTYLGGTGIEAGEGIAVDGAGNVFITGYSVAPGGVLNFPTQESH